MKVLNQFATSVFFGTWVVLLQYFYYSIFLERKKKWKLGYIVLLLLIIGTARNYVGVFVDNTFPFFEWTRPLLSLLILFVSLALALMPFSGNIRKKLLLLMLYPVIGIASESIVNLFLVQILQKDLKMLGTNITLQDQMNIMSALVNSIMLIIIRVVYRISGRTKIQTRTFALELMVPLLSAVACTYFMRFNEKEFASMMLFIVLFNVVALLIYNRQEEYHKQNQEYALQQQYDTFREEHYRELEAHQAEIRAMKHDLKNQLIAMDAYVKSGFADRAGVQLGALIEQLSDSDRLIFTEHAGVNGLLSTTYRQAKKEGVLCDFKVDLPEDIGIADTDLVAILGNILDNALEACRFCEGNSYIRLEMAQRNNTLLLRCENSTDGKAASFKTRKEKPEHHGIGMQTVQQVVEKYDGELQCQFAGHRFVLELSLFLKASDCSGGR